MLSTLIIGVVAIGVIGLFFLFFRFTIVEEGTAKIIIRLGSFHKALLQWEGHYFDDDWRVWRRGEPGAPREEKKVFGKLLGGLWWYGFWPIDRIYKYNLRWADLRLQEGVQKVHFHEETLTHVMLKPAVYWTKIFGAETKVPERIPVDIEVLVTMRVMNPYRFLFVAPPTPLEDILARIDALLRSRVSLLSLDELLALKGKADILWEREGELPGLKDEKLITETLPNWGIRVAERGIEIKDVKLPPEYQEAAAIQRRREWEATGRAAETVGSVLYMMAQACGRPVEEIKKEIDTNPEMRREFLDLAKDLIVRKLGIEGESYLDIRVQGAEGVERMILNALAAWQRMPRRKPKEPKGKKEVKEEEVPPLSEEEETRLLEELEEY